MTTLELPSMSEAEWAAAQVTEADQTSKVQRVGQALSRAVGWALGLNVQPPEYLSEHFGHASKRNDLNPHFDDPRG